MYVLLHDHVTQTTQGVMGSRFIYLSFYITKCFQATSKKAIVYSGLWCKQGCKAEACRKQLNFYCQCRISFVITSQSKVLQMFMSTELMLRYVCYKASRPLGHVYSVFLPQTKIQKQLLAVLLPNLGESFLNTWGLLKPSACLNWGLKHHCWVFVFYSIQF